jgi:Holliday junction resolvase
MRDISSVIASIREDLDEHDRLTAELGVNCGERVDVIRSDVETLVAFAERHLDCHPWIALPDRVMDTVRTGGSGRA